MGECVQKKHNPPPMESGVETEGVKWGQHGTTPPSCYNGWQEEDGLLHPLNL